jgi:hypothetical protein
MGALRATRALASAVTIGAAAVGLVWAGATTGTPPILHPATMSRWLADQDAATVVFSTMRMLSLVGLVWLLSCGLAWSAAAVAPSAAVLTRIGRQITPRWLIPVIAGASMAASSATGAAAWATTKPSMAPGAPRSPAIAMITGLAPSPPLAPPRGSADVGQPTPAAPSAPSSTPASEASPARAPLIVGLPTTPTSRPFVTTSPALPASASVAPLANAPAPHSGTRDAGRVGGNGDPGATGAVERTLKVAPGDNLWSIAKAVVEERLGPDPGLEPVADYWLRLVAANRDRLIRPGDPDLIQPGQTLLLPS